MQERLQAFEEKIPVQASDLTRKPLSTEGSVDEAHFASTGALRARDNTAPCSLCSLCSLGTENPDYADEQGTKWT